MAQPAPLFRDDLGCPLCQAACNYGLTKGPVEIESRSPLHRFETETMKSSEHRRYFGCNSSEISTREFGSFFSFYFGFLSYFAFWDRRAG